MRASGDQLRQIAALVDSGVLRPVVGRVFDFDQTWRPCNRSARAASAARQSSPGYVGAVTGSLTRPELLVVGRYRGKELEVVGRTVQLKTNQAGARQPSQTGGFRGIPGPIRSAPTGAGAAIPRSSRSTRVSWSRSPPTQPCRPATIAIRCGSRARARRRLARPRRGQPAQQIAASAGGATWPRMVQPTNRGAGCGAKLSAPRRKFACGAE
jgi:hypothetical protein